MKTHLNYTVKGERTTAALCGNNGRNYKYGLKTATPEQFRALPRGEHCAHCCFLYLQRRNAQRRAKGLPPVQVWDEGFTAGGAQ